jgi:sporulation protein YlmC with PRC-barrel domain
MNQYMIRRRSAWASPDELKAAAARSTEVADAEFPETIRWIRSYVVQEDDGRLGTACVYEARDAETVREHAGRVGMPADEVLAIADTVIVRSDPVASSAS